MKRIIRELFDERKKREDGQTVEFFNEDTLSKILRLMHQYSFNQEVIFKGKANTVDNFLNRLSYQLPDTALNGVYELNGLKRYLLKSSLNEFISTIELFLITLQDECAYYFNYNYSSLNSFIIDFNSLVAIKTIPFRIEITKESRFFIGRINSILEEENKQKVYVLLRDIEFQEVEEHFTNSLVDFAKRKYPESVEETYLALEKYLKIKISNHKLDASEAYSKFKKKFNIERGIFKVHQQKIKERIDFVYTIRSEIKSHSDKKTFDRNDLLEETARFQLNEVMNLILLLNSFKEVENGKNRIN